MAETIDSIDIEYTEDDKVVVKQLDKNVLTRGSWTTIMFLYQELDKNTDAYGPAKVSIRRYQKRNGVYRQQSKFNISSAKQAHEMIGTLLKWYPKDGEGAALASSSEAEQDAGDAD